MEQYIQLSNDDFGEHGDYHHISSLNFPVTTVQSRLEILPIYIRHVLTVLMFFKGFMCRQRLFCGRLLQNRSNQC